MITDHAQTIKKLPSWLYKLGSQAFISKDYPRHLFIETTAACQLRCSYCPRERTSSSMDFGLFKKIIDEASEYGPRSFSLHLFGEPLLYKSIFEACAYIKQSNPRHTILLTTNGIRVNDCIDDIVSSGINQVFWTWRKEVRFRESTLLKLREWGKFRVRFIHEVTPEEAYKEWEDWKNVENRPMHNYGGEIELSNFSKHQIKTSMEPNKRWPCYHLWLAPAVAWNGKFLMCCADPHQKEVFGDVNIESVSSLWDKLEQVRQSHLKGEYKGICETCDVWKQYPDIFFNFQKK